MVDTNLAVIRIRASCQRVSTQSRFLAPVPALLKSAYNSLIIGPRGLGW